MPIRNPAKGDPRLMSLSTSHRRQFFSSDATVFGNLACFTVGGVHQDKAQFRIIGVERHGGTRPEHLVVGMGGHEQE